MTISGITNTTQTTNSTSSTPASKTLGESDFLKLLTTQLQAQNPLNPMDSTNFTAQLAQFSSLEQLTNINSEMSSLLASQQSLQNTMVTSLIGKTVRISGNTVTLNGQAAMQYSLGSDASKVTISVYDTNGALVKSTVLGAQGAGKNTFTWDGRDSNGNVKPSGQYTFSVSAVDAAGAAVTATPVYNGVVTGVAFENSTTYLTIDNSKQVKLGDILEISGGA
ncbi:MAG TPA: flagellar hook assembly protein FlgD [Nitrospirota bacterium]|nr:flagellar hook assembly protein FlgD [Nitrospirota bacterium]